MSLLTPLARAAEMEQIRRELEPRGSLLCVHADTTQEAIDVTRLALTGLPEGWRVATVDLGRCPTTQDVITAFAHAVAILYLEDAARLRGILEGEAGRDRAELIDFAEAGGAPLLALLEGVEIAHGQEFDLYGRALHALTGLAAGAGQPVVLALLAADELLAPERKGQLGVDRALLWNLRAHLQNNGAPLRLVLSGGPATIDLVADEGEAFSGWGKEIAITPLSPERLQGAVTAATMASDLDDPVGRWLPGIVRLAEGSAVVASDLLELLWFGTLMDIDLFGQPRIIDSPDEAFLTLIELNAMRIRQEVRVLRALDPAALPIALAVARGRPPYEAVRFSSDASRALRTLRRAGFVTQRKGRTWSLTDPLLAGWLRRPAAWGPTEPLSRGSLPF